MARYDVVLTRRVQAVSGAPQFVEIAPIDVAHFVWEQTVGAPGSVEVGCTVDSLEADAKAALLDLSVTPCELWVYRDDVQVHAGPVTDLRIDGRALTLVCPGLLAYIDYWVFIDAFYSATNQDQAAIVADLIGDYQAQPYADFGLDATHLTSGVLRDLNLLGAEMPHLSAVIAEMGARDNGFDLDVDMASRRLIMYTPRQGSDLSASVFLTARSIGDPHYSQSVGPGVLAAEVAVTSSSAGGVSLAATAEDVALRNTFGRVMATTSFQDVSVQATLEEHADRFLTDHSSPLHQVSPGLISVPGFEYGGFGKGDTVTYEYDAGLGIQTFELRVKTISVTTDSGVEEMSVAFF